MININKLNEARCSHLIYEALELLGWKGDSESLVNYVKRLSLGLPKEDEFSVILAWLGKCSLIHKIDNIQIPTESKKLYQVPDLLAIFQNSGRDYPVLIEVKSKNKLSWRPDYYEALKRYGEVLNLPVLIAWNYMSFWALFELKHFRKINRNYQIDFETAMKQNLMGVLCGDFSFSIKAGVGWHMYMRKLEPKNKSKDNSQLVKIEKNYFSNHKGEEIKNDPGFLKLFLCINQDVDCTEDENYIYQSFIIPENSQSEFASRALVSILNVFKGKNGINWSEIIKTDYLSGRYGELQNIAKDCQKLGLLNTILNQVPQDYPEFLNKLNT